MMAGSPSLLLRYQIFLAYGVLFLAVWQALLLQQAQSESSNSHSTFIQYLPVWALVALAIYGISSIAIGVMTFRDTPEAAAELEGHIAEAKKEMTKRGIIKEDKR
jgi:cytochrome c biogenesis protein ResB